MDGQRPVTDFLKRHVSKAAALGLLGIFWLAFAIFWWMPHDPSMHQTTFWRFLSVVWAVYWFSLAYREWRKRHTQGT